MTAWVLFGGASSFGVVTGAGVYVLCPRATAKSQFLLGGAAVLNQQRPRTR